MKKEFLSNYSFQTQGSHPQYGNSNIIIVFVLLSFFQAGNGTISSRVPWFVRQWRVPLNRCIYTAFSYMMFLFFIILYVAETQPPIIYWIDIFTATWIMSYTCRDMGTGARILHQRNARKHVRSSCLYWLAWNILMKGKFLNDENSDSLVFKNDFESGVNWDMKSSFDGEVWHNDLRRKFDQCLKMINFCCFGVNNPTLKRTPKFPNHSIAIRPNDLEESFKTRKYDIDKTVFWHPSST